MPRIYLKPGQSIVEAFAAAKSPIKWRPWKDAPRDGRWLIARSNDKVSLYRVSWGVDRKGVVGWCGPDKSYGDGLFEPYGGWIDWPQD